MDFDKTLSIVPVALVVDPQEARRKRYARALNAVAEDVDQAEDGADALACALARPPQVVLTALHMPRIDGPALCGFLRADPATRDATIIVFTTVALPAHIERARRAGASDIIFRPSDPLVVCERARQLVLRSGELRITAAQIEQPLGVVDRGEPVRRRIMSRSYDRRQTSTPPAVPPDAHCPRCDRLLVYQHSFIGGVTARFAEQWDHFTCANCGQFEYRHRTRRLTRL